MSSKKRQEKRRAAIRRKQKHLQQRASHDHLLKRLLRVFGENSTAMLNMAARGDTAEEIADSLEVPVSEVESFIEEFTTLPNGVDQLLLRAPNLLAESNTMKSLFRSVSRGAKRTRSFR